MVFRQPSARLTLLALPGIAAVIAFLVLALQPAGGPTFALEDWRSIFAIPLALVAIMITGAGAYFISIWVWSMRPNVLATGLFAFSGVMTLLFTYSAGMWGLAFPVTAQQSTILGIVNFLAASAFGMSMIALFLIYPNRLPGWKWGILAMIVIFAPLTLLAQFNVFDQARVSQGITLAEMIVIAGLVVVQMVQSRTDPRQRAISVWLGSSVLIGAGFFIITVALPSTFGRPALVPVPYAFCSFLLIYVGLAAGLVRYRIFDLGQWSLFLLFHLAALLFMVAIDLMLIRFLAFESGAALGLAVLIAAFLYLPARAWVWRRLVPEPVSDEAALFRSVVEVALQPSARAREEQWKDLLARVFHPLDIQPMSHGEETPALGQDGLTLMLPATGWSGPLLLSNPGSGRRLFSMRDAEISQQMIDLMTHTEASRGEYDRGVAEERTRIARDIHDNIGAQLMRALHSGPVQRKDAMIRETLSDLRDIINNAEDSELAADIQLADLRAEIAERLEAHDISLDWQLSGQLDRVLSAASLHALRSVIREATSNTIKHADANTFSLRLDIESRAIHCQLSDDGRGFETDAKTTGHGLNNMRARIEGLGGAFALISAPVKASQPNVSTMIDIQLPLVPDAGAT
jgi:signal transduction histidine kinase